MKKLTHYEFYDKEWFVSPCPWCEDYPSLTIDPIRFDSDGYPHGDRFCLRCQCIKDRYYNRQSTYGISAYDDENDDVDPITKIVNSWNNGHIYLPLKINMPQLCQLTWTERQIGKLDYNREPFKFVYHVTSERGIAERLILDMDVLIDKSTIKTSAYKPDMIESANGYNYRFCLTRPTYYGMVDTTWAYLVSIERGQGGYYFTFNGRLTIGSIRRNTKIDTAWLNRDHIVTAKEINLLKDMTDE
ncbi:MAG: hypothetical protein WC284_16165 [Candidimonas sp.]